MNTQLGPSKNKNRILKKLLLVPLLALVFAGGFFANKYFESTRQNSSQQIVAATKDEILSQLSAMIILPQEPNPQIAKINNVDQLKEGNPEFYANAQNGDTLIIYSAEAVIYRTTTHLIVNVAPIKSE